jgi:hypothetical protein
LEKIQNRVSIFVPAKILNSKSCFDFYSGKHLLDFLEFDILDEIATKSLKLAPKNELDFNSHNLFKKINQKS